MSQYKTIETQFKNEASLLKALVDVGFTQAQIEKARNTKSPDLRLKTYGGGFHPQACSIALRKEKIGGYEDTGFYWNGSAYQAIVSTHDGERYAGHRDFGEGTLKQVKQRYAVNEAKRLAKLKGYTVQEQKAPDGTVTLTCNAWR